MRAWNIGIGLVVAGYLAAPVSAAVVIDEWMYDGSEFIEIKNTGPASVSLAGWSFDDSTRTPGTLDLSSFGSLATGEVALITQDAPAAFRTLWGLPASVKIVQNNAADVLQRSDEINLYDASNALVDRLTYNDQAAADSAAKSPRTQNVSGNLPPASYGTNTASAAVLSALGDAYGSYAAPGNASLIASPGNVPEPAGLAVVAGAGMIVARRRRTAR